MDDFVTVGTYESYALAGLDRQKLEQHDIICFLADEHTIALRWDLNVALGGIKLRVPETDAEKAKFILRKGEEVQVDFKIEKGDNEVICPKCDSNNVGTEKFAKGIFGWSWIILGFPIIKKSSGNHRCFYCGHEWKGE